MALIPFGQFEPSRSPFNPNASPNVINALPKADGWGPMPSLVVLSDALPSECRGAIYVRDSDGNVTIFAGTATALYRYNTATTAWDDISRVSGGAYALPSGDNWSFTRFGQYLVATQIGDAPQVFDIDSGTNFEALSGSPPNAKYCWTAGPFLVLGYLVGFPSRIRWSGLEDIGTWELGENFADLQDLPDGEEVQGGISEAQGAIIIQRRAIRYMQLQSSGQFAFSVQVLNPSRGAVSPLSIVQIGPRQFAYLSEDGFFMGVEGQPIGAATIDDWFLNEQIDLDELSVVQGTADPYSKIIWWQYSDTSGNKRMIGYEWQLGRWTYSNVAVGFLMSALTAGTTMDALALDYATLDEITIPLDSRAFKGGRPIFSGFNSDNKLCTFSGTPLAATIDTAQSAPAGNMLRAFCNGARVVSDAPASGYTLQIGVSDKHGDEITWKTAASPSSETGLVPLRASGRLHKFRLSMTAGTDWTHAHGVEPNVRREGAR